MSGARESGQATETASLRLDKWLWFARFCKSRSLAAKLCASGHIRLSGEPGSSAHVAKPSQTVRPGDVLTFPLGRQVRVVRVLALGSRRGPAAEARALYEDLTPPQPKTGPLQGRRDPGSGRPTKRERRQIDRLLDEEGESGK
ncbi:MAG: RNA-binding S4 domain-containing protein [Pseudomonadota bacterium]